MVDDDRPSPADETEPPDRCARCGTGLDPGSWHPTVGYTDSHGTYRLVRFCSDACRDDWQPTREESDGA